MSVTKRGSSYQVAVYYRGREYRRSSKRWSKTQAREVERKLYDDLHAQEIGRKPDRSFFEAVKKWKAEFVPRLRNERSRHEALLTAGYVAPYVEGRLIKEAPEIASKMKEDWAHLSPATVNRRLSILKRWCSLAWKEWRWLDAPITFSMLTEPPPRQLFLTPKQVQALARECPRSGDLVLLAAYTGIRRGQLMRLSKEQVTAGCFNLGPDGKTGQPQLVPIHQEIAHIVKRLPVRTTTRILNVEWDAARKKLGLEKVRWHDLRHTFASWLMHSGADLLHVRDLLGHSDVAVTQRYAHLRTEHLRAAVARIPRSGKR